MRCCPVGYLAVHGMGWFNTWPPKRSYVLMSSEKAARTLRSALHCCSQKLRFDTNFPSVSAVGPGGYAVCVTVNIGMPAKYVGEMAACFCLYVPVAV